MSLRAELVGGGLLDGGTFFLPEVGTPPDHIYVPVLESGEIKYLESTDEYTDWPKKAEFVCTGRLNEVGEMLYQFKGYK